MMIQTRVEVIADDQDQEVAQIAHRVNVAKVTLTYLDGAEVTYERAEQSMDVATFCERCCQPMIYDPELEDWRHHPTNEVTHQCYLRKQGLRT